MLGRVLACCTISCSDETTLTLHSPCFESTASGFRILGSVFPTYYPLLLENFSLPLMELFLSNPHLLILEAASTCHPVWRQQERHSRRDWSEDSDGSMGISSHVSLARYLDLKQVPWPQYGLEGDLRSHCHSSNQLNKSYLFLLLVSFISKDRVAELGLLELSRSRLWPLIMPIIR